MSDNNVPARLAEFSPDDKTPRLVRAVLSVVPGMPELTPYPALPSVCAALGGAPIDVARAAGHLNDEDIRDILWMSALVDTGDKGYAVLTGVSSAVGLFFGRGQKALDNDTQQRNDAVLKAFALAYMAWKSGNVAGFPQLPAGRALLTWYAAMELALPFADNAATRGGDLLGGLLGSHGPAQLQRFTGLLGGRSADGVQSALQTLTGPINATLQAVLPHARSLATSASAYVPSALATADAAAGVLAAAVDVMPVYRYLGARLAAEAVMHKVLPR